MIPEGETCVAQCHPDCKDGKAGTGLKMQGAEGFPTSVRLTGFLCCDFSQI